MTWRAVLLRTTYLLLGGAIALAFLMLSAGLLSPFQSEARLDWRFFLGAALLPIAGVGLLPGLREVQVAALQTLVGVDGVVVPVPMRWEHRWRTALGTFVHEVLGLVVGLAIVGAIWVVAGVAVLAVGQGQALLLATIERPTTALGWVGVGAAALGASSPRAPSWSGPVGPPPGRRPCSSAPSGPIGWRWPRRGCAESRSTAASRATCMTAWGMR